MRGEWMAEVRRWSCGSRWKCGEEGKGVEAVELRGQEEVRDQVERIRTRPARREQRRTCGTRSSKLRRGMERGKYRGYTYIGQYLNS